MSHLSTLRRFTHNTRARLSFSAHHLTLPDILYIFYLIICKHLSALIGFRKPPKPSLITANTFDFPSLSLTAPVDITSADLSTWHSATTSKSAKAPITSQPQPSSLLLSTTLTTPLHLLLLSTPLSPILPLGAVNTQNRFEFLRPSTLHNLASKSRISAHSHQATATSTSSTSLTARARFGGSDFKGVRVRRGVEFGVEVEVVDGEGSVLVRQVVGTLQFLKQRVGGAALVAVNGDEKVEVEYGDEQVELELDWEAPRRWAAVCKDYNPIHISRLAARLFGFPGKIAHGNHVVALVMEMVRDCDMGSEGIKALREIWWESERPCWMEVAFKRPMVLPAVLGVKVGKVERGGVIHFAVVKGDKICVEGKTGYL